MAWQLVKGEEMIICRLQEMVRLGAVSYTHLDVYKRQGLDETVLIEGDENTEEKGTKTVPNSYNHT